MTQPPNRIRYFTPREAEGVLDTLREHVSRATDGARQIRQFLTAIRNDPTMSQGERNAALEQVEHLRTEITHIVETISAQGVEVKSLDPPLLDFPGLLNGREVYLCWKGGERHITWWHPLHTDVSERQPLDEWDDGQWEWCH